MSEDHLPNSEFTAGDNFFGQMIEAGVADQQFIQEIVQMFIEEGQLSLYSLAQAIEQGDFSNVRLYAHKLKSSFLIFDMIEAHDFAVQLEKDDMNNRESITTIYEALQNNCDIIFTKLRHKYLET